MVFSKNKQTNKHTFNLLMEFLSCEMFTFISIYSLIYYSLPTCWPWVAVAQIPTWNPTILDFQGCAFHFLPNSSFTV